jgi:hypothetical protein
MEKGRIYVKVDLHSAEKEHSSAIKQLDTNNCLLFVLYYLHFFSTDWLTWRVGHMKGCSVGNLPAFKFTLFCCFVVIFLRKNSQESEY